MVEVIAGAVCENDGNLVAFVRYWECIIRMSAIECHKATSQFSSFRMWVGAPKA